MKPSIIISIETLLIFLLGCMEFLWWVSCWTNRNRENWNHEGNFLLLTTFTCLCDLKGYAVEPIMQPLHIVRNSHFDDTFRGFSFRVLLHCWVATLWPLVALRGCHPMEWEKSSWAWQRSVELYYKATQTYHQSKKVFVFIKAKS